MTTTRDKLIAGLSWDDGFAAGWAECRGRVLRLAAWAVALAGLIGFALGRSM